MNKPGFDDRTIDARDRLTQKIRRRDGVLTIVLWVVYAYLWLPLVSLFAWYLGFSFAYRLVEQAGGPSRLVRLLAWFALFAVVAAAGVVTWSRLELRRFGVRERRRSSPVLTPQQEIDHWQIEQGRFDQIRNSQRLLIDLDARGRFLSVADRSQRGLLVPRD
ncbi:MAG TPA: poly-beta-1,6-N-acetyl-D-glucosamine biosynthesis protein PgaD [Candidatus Polarisedimenticolaceae bacterium]|nr:poly-beta-1,6-N-acetyl-D-glucosamine biosynthesis protein PgaD [Candidatus Polarisedimenticolaceae bacterium]